MVFFHITRIGIENHAARKGDDRHTRRIAYANLFQHLRTELLAFADAVENTHILHLQAAVQHLGLEIHLAGILQSEKHQRQRPCEKHDQ